MDDFIHKRNRYEYARRGNPNSESLNEAWRALNGSAGAVSVSSGLAAVTLALLSCLKAGDHILVTDSVYKPTRELCDGLLNRLGIETTYYDPLIAAGIETLFKTNTRAVYTESPGSLTFEVQDIPAIAKVAQAHNALVLMDNTWATPLFFAAHKHGVDLCIEAGTKYLVGHSDAMIGMVSANEKAWPALDKTYGLMGVCSAPEDMFLSLRGLRTLGVRLKHQEKAALNIATWLTTRPEVARVLHPALPSCPGHEIWKRDFSGSCGLFGIELHETSCERVAAMVDNLELFGIGASWGGFESLIIPFDCGFRCAENPKCMRLRLQIGLEDEKDLIADLEEGFARLKA